MGALGLRIFERWSLRKRRPDLPALRELLGSGPDLRVVDLGGGTGLTTDAFSSPGMRAIVLEPDMDKVSFGRRRRPRLRFVRGRAEALPFSDGSIDRAVGIVSLHHVERPDRALEEVRRILRPGGRLVLLELYPDRPGLMPQIFSRHTHGTRPHFLEPGDLQATLADHGFRDVLLRQGAKGYLVSGTR